MALLHEDAYLSAIKNELSSTCSSLLIFSAYIKRKALEELATKIADKVDVKLIVRWNKIDLLSGASDLDIYEFCKERRWKVAISTNLHGKLYLFDRKTIILGSSNLTGKGLGLVSSSNLEFGTYLDASEVDSEKLESFSDAARLVDDELFDLLKENLLDGYSEGGNTSWPNEILEMISLTKSFLWVEDCLFSTPQELLRLNLSSERQCRDFSTLNLNLDRISLEHLRTEFLSSVAGRWLIKTVRENEGINFGGLSSKLHDALLNDPKPFRKDVKTLLATLIEWAKICPETFFITQYNRTVTLSVTG